MRPMSAIHNERVRLTATALNNTAVAVVVTGVVVPGAGVAYSLAAAPPSRGWWLVALAWLAGALALHLGARFTLGRLRP